MAEASTILTAQRYAVVTGANKGVGFEICRLLYMKGVTVILTSRDEKKGVEAVCRLKEELSQQGSASLVGVGEVLFHQLEVTDSASIGSLVEFIESQYGKLDILVNNVGISGIVMDGNAFRRAVERAGGWPIDEQEWKEIATQDHKMAEECLATNYLGAKRVTEALIPLLQQSDSPRIVNISSLLGLLKNIPRKSATDALSDMESLTRDGIEKILMEFVDDFRQGRLEANGWPVICSAYILSKAALNAYTRLLAKELPSFLVNSICPGFIKTDMTFNTGFMSPLEGAESPVFLALLPKTGPSGLFFSRKEVFPF